MPIQKYFLDINLDFENRLHKPNFEFDYLLLFILQQAEIASLSQPLPLDFTKYLLARKIDIADFSLGTKEGDNYWLPEKKINQEKLRKFNSKIFAARKLRELNLDPMETICLKAFDKVQITKDKVYVFREDYSFSGKGALWVKNCSEWMAPSDGILRPWVKRFFDFSFRLDEAKQKLVISQNLISSKGQFLACLTSGEEQVNDSETKIKLKQIIESYRAEGITGDFVFDAFTYYRDEINNLNPVLMPMCECNYRKTMSIILYKIHQKYHLGQYGLLRLWPRPKKLKDFSQLLKEKTIMEDPQVLILSPFNRQFISVYFAAESSESMLAKANSFETKIVHAYR